MDIVIDFDGTCVKHDFPYMGEDIGAVPVLKALTDNGHRLILFTMRSDGQEDKILENGHKTFKGDYLTQAVNWFIDNGIPLYGVQTNPTQNNWTSSPKAYGQLIIDDAALGCPLKIDEGTNRAYVDWVKVKRKLIGIGLL